MMTLGRLRWIALASVIVAVALIEVVREVLYPYLQTWPGRLLQDGVILVLALALIGAMFNVVERTQRGVERQHREVAALHAAALGLTTMRERAESIGGTVRWDSRPRAGTRVTVEIPREQPSPPPHSSMGASQ
ncbi:MAG TPA: hypothetical protein VFE33_28995 [Thermoanaerobaculia bacterium]|nr:hypothetical protein [Thermoanaerobaculia bacterium]